MALDIATANIASSGNAVSITTNSITGLNFNAYNFPVKAKRPYFVAQGTADWTQGPAGGGWANIQLNYAVVNNNSCYNTSTYSFTAPVSGFYYFEASTYGQKYPYTTAAGYMHPIFRINDSYTYRQASATTPYRLRARTYYDGSYTCDTQINDIFYLAAADYVTYHMYFSNDLRYYPPYSLFSGYLIG
jgi:hypothetical protein